eukprot:TRINITY_DN14363_c0_g1_i1.p1 TRINITY_DN14363_c0_g1~~TRINITY_DN14363_c0_g1_i1.p1  ORF type:complete len:117 (+),score=12.98 TRINITY_DN14363_c0_g1_i1:50-400(+)
MGAEFGCNPGFRDDGKNCDSKRGCGLCVDRDRDEPPIDACETWQPVERARTKEQLEVRFDRPQLRQFPAAINVADNDFDADDKVLQNSLKPALKQENRRSELKRLRFSGSVRFGSG